MLKYLVTALYLYFSCSLSENDLLVNCKWLVDDFLAELIKRSGNSLVLTGTELLCCLNLVNGGGSTFYSQEDLWQVLGFLVGNSPLVKLWLVNLNLFDSIFSLSCFLAFSWLWLGSNFDLWESLPLEGVLVNNFWLICKLETNDGLNLPDVLLDIKELIHESKLKLIFLL
jgi:hypothetical protein